MWSVEWQLVPIIKHFNLNHECQNLFGEGSQPLLRVGSRTARVKVMIIGASDFLN